MKQPSKRPITPPVTVPAFLQDLVKYLGGQVKKRTTHLYGGTILTHQLRALYSKHKIELLANTELILIDVGANYGQFQLLQINPRGRIYAGGMPAHKINTGDRKYTVFATGGKLSNSQSELCKSGALGKLLDVIDPHESEEINVSQRLVRIYLQRPDATRIMGVINAVIDLMPHNVKTRSEFSRLPNALRPLIPLLAKWAIDDDEERSQKLKRSAQPTLKKLVDVAVPLLPAIDEFLDSFGANPPEEACAFGSLAQAALEAQTLLSNAPQRLKPE